MAGTRASPAAVSKADQDRVVAAAIEAREHAYAPYSAFRVGAAILTRTGRIYTGCNVENASYGATLCAERAAVAAMVAGGDAAVAAMVAGGDKKAVQSASPSPLRPLVCAIATGVSPPAPPCGICRQVLAEFAHDLLVLLVTVRGTRQARKGGQPRKKGAHVTTTYLSSLLPQAFHFEAQTNRVRNRK
jgi:cytidine deaminase